MRETKPQKRERHKKSSICKNLCKVPSPWADVPEGHGEVEALRQKVYKGTERSEVLEGLARRGPEVIPSSEYSAGMLGGHKGLGHWMDGSEKEHERIQDPRVKDPGPS